MVNYLIGLAMALSMVATICAPSQELKKEKKMGQYINDIEGEHIGTTFEQKCHALEHFGAVQVDGEQYEKDLVCVVDNGPFATAGYAFNQAEYEEFKSPCGRRKQWFKLDNAAEYVSKH